MQFRLIFMTNCKSFVECGSIQRPTSDNNNAYALQITNVVIYLYLKVLLLVCPHLLSLNLYPVACFAAVHDFWWGGIFSSACLVDFFHSSCSMLPCRSESLFLRRIAFTFFIFPVKTEGKRKIWKRKMEFHVRKGLWCNFLQWRKTQGNATM